MEIAKLSIADASVSACHNTIALKSIEKKTTSVRDLFKVLCVCVFVYTGGLTVPGVKMKSGSPYGGQRNHSPSD